MRKILTFTLLLFSLGMNAQCDLSFDAMLADPNGANNFDTDGDGSADSDDEFVQICNLGASSIDLSLYTLADDDGNSFPLSGTLAAGMCVVVIADYDGTAPANFIDLNTSPWMNNGGDDITLSGPGCNISFSYPGDWSEQDGCVSVGGTVDCAIVPSDLGSTPLPVEFIDIKVVRNQILWRTAQEVNNSHFEIQKSTDGVSFDIIGSVEGKGNTKEITSYSFEDKSPSVTGVDYYRLKQYDFNGEFQYSKIISAVRTTKSLISVNNVLQSRILNISGIQNASKVSIFDSFGNLVLETKLVEDAQVSYDFLNTGIYFAVITNEFENVSKKFFIQ